MLYGLLSRNSTLATIVALLSVVVLRARQIVEPERYVVAPNSRVTAGPLWDATLGAIEPASLLATLIAWALVLITGLLLGRLVHDNHLSIGATNMPLITYVALSGGMARAMTLQPAHLYALLAVCALLLLFTATRRNHPQGRVAWAAALLTLGAMLWAPLVWCLPFTFFMLVVLRLSHPRCVLAALLGMAAVAILTCAISLLVAPDFDIFQRFAQATTEHVRPLKLDPYTITYLLGILLLGVVAALRTATCSIITGVVEHRKMLVCRWLALLAVLLTALPMFSYCTQTLAAVGAAVFLPAWLANLRSHALQETVTDLLLFGTAIYTWI